MRTLSMGIVHLRKGALQRAIAEFQRATTPFPEHDLVPGRLGQTWARSGKSAEARKLVQLRSHLCGPRGEGSGLRLPGKARRSPFKMGRWHQLVYDFVGSSQ